mgnify:CR=1 FL=1
MVFFIIITYNSLLKHTLEDNSSQIKEITKYYYYTQAAPIVKRIFYMFTYYPIFPAAPWDGRGIRGMTGDDGRCGGLSFEKVPRTPKELGPMVCRGGYYPPANDTFAQINGRTGDTGNFLLRKFPEPFKEFVERLWQKRLVSRHFAYGKTMVDFWKSSSKVCKQPFFRASQKPTGIFPRGGKFCPETRAKTV